MEQLEQEIMELEARTEAVNNGLVEASTTGDADAIRELSKELHEAQAKSEALYSELAEASSTHDRLETEYASMLQQQG